MNTVQTTSSKIISMGKISRAQIIIWATSEQDNMSYIPQIAIASAGKTKTNHTTDLSTCVTSLFHQLWNLPSRQAWMLPKDRKTFQNQAV